MTALVKDRFRLNDLINDRVAVPAKVEDPKHYGMHRHLTDAGCVLLYGGGMKRGHLHGLTADERPCKTIKDRVVIEDLHASIYRAVGISPKLAYEIEKLAASVSKPAHRFALTHGRFADAINDVGGITRTDGS